ncbi:MAG: response regulator [Blastocatellia bacterium]
MGLQQVKNYVSVRYAEHLTRFKGVSNEQIVKSYSFNYELLKTANRLIEKAASSIGTTLIVGKRGVGKTHMLSLVRSLINQPSLATIILDVEARAALQKHSLQKVPVGGIASLTLGFDLERGMDFIKVFPVGSVQTLALRGWVDANEILEIVNIGIEKFQDYVLFVDGLSPALKHPEKRQYTYHLIETLIQEANKGAFALVIALDEDIIASGSNWSEFCQIEQIDISNLAMVVEQKLFRKSLEQRNALTQLYQEILSSMPHFSCELADFINLYPAHPMILSVSPSMQRYVKGFSLLGFLTEISPSALVRRDTSLINIDDLFENLEEELRKHPYLKEVFGVYDNLLYWSAINLDTQKALYAKLLLRGLLLLSLRGQGATIEEIANAVMLNDERSSRNFLSQMQRIMNSLIAADERLGLIDFGKPQYIFRSLFEMEPLNTEQLNPTKLSSEQLAIIQASLADEKPPTKSLSLLEMLHKTAEQIDDSDPRLSEILFSIGKKFFKDWPFVFEQNGLFKRRAELNVRWSGSLRRGIISLGEEIEILTEKNNPNNQINEYDWQIVVLLPNQKHTANLSTVPNAPNTLIYWQPAEFSKEDFLILKYLLIINSDAVVGFDTEELSRYIAAFETTLVDLFGLNYLDIGKLFNLYYESWSLNYHSSNFISIILSKLLDQSLSERYPQHPRFEDLLDPDYLDEIISWIFSSSKTPTPDQQLYLEQFVRPLGLVKVEGRTYSLDVNDKIFPEDSAIALFLELLESNGDRPITKLQAYRLLRKEPFGLQRPILLVILAALAAADKITLVDEQSRPIHNETGLLPDVDISSFSSIYLAKPKIKITSWEKKKAIESQSTFSNQTIMIVDDEPDILTCIEIAIEPLGCQMKTAINGIDALKQLLQDSKVDLVISDLMMPGMDGVQLFYEMQTNPQLRDIPFIVLSSIDTEEDITKALESGVTDYWTKPFSIAELTARIRKFLRRRLATSDAYSITAWPNEKTPKSAPFALSEFKSGEMKVLPTPKETIAAKPPEIAETQLVNLTFSDTEIDFNCQKLYDQFADVYLRSGNMTAIPSYEDFEAELMLKLNKLRKQFRCDNFMLYVEVKEGKSEVYCQLVRSTEYLSKEPKFLLI